MWCIVPRQRDSLVSDEISKAVSPSGWVPFVPIIFSSTSRVFYLPKRMGPLSSGVSPWLRDGREWTTRPSPKSIGEWMCRSKRNARLCSDWTIPNCWVGEFPIGCSIPSDITVRCSPGVLRSISNDIAYYCGCSLSKPELESAKQHAIK